MYRSIYGCCVKNGLIGSLQWLSLYLILLLQRNRKTSCSLWLRNEALKGELWMSGTENNMRNVCFRKHLFQIHVSNLVSKFELPVDWHFTGNFVVLIMLWFFFWVQKVVNDAYKKLFPKQKEVPPNQMFCNLLNISMCQATENNKQVRTMEGADLWRKIIILYKQIWKIKPLNQIII